MNSGVLERPLLEAVGGKEDCFLGARRTLLVNEDLNVLSFNWSRVVLALHQDQEFDAQLPETGGNIDPVLPVRGGHQILVLNAEARQVSPRFS